MNADIYERHARAVEFWREACKAVERAERTRDETRAELDAVGQELLASCANSASKPEKKTRRRRANGKLVVEGVLAADRLTKIKPNGAEEYAE